MTVRSNKGQTLTPVYGSKLKRRRSICYVCDKLWEYTSASFRPKCDACIEAARTKERSADSNYHSKYVGAAEKADIKRALKTAFNPAEFRRTVEHAKAKGWITASKGQI